MKIDQEKLYWHFKRHSGYVPVLIALLATPFMIIAITTHDSGVEIFVKLIWLVLTLAMLGYNLLFRRLRKKFENSSLKS
jgi:uncharacterized membrane protein (DUF2068 family)